MSGRKKYFILTGVLVLILITQDSYSQVVQQKASRQDALEAYSRGDFERALNGFYLLLQKYPKDPLYKYYIGVCLVKMNRHPEDAMEYLQGALDGALDIKSIPDDGLFYLGRSQQMAGRFDEALRSYDSFEEKAGRKQAREYNISKYIQECHNGTGRIIDTEFRPADFVSRAEQSDKEVDERVSAGEKADLAAATPIQQKAKVPEDYDKVLSEAMDYQVKADSLNALAREYKKNLVSLPSSQQQNAKSEISDLESRAAAYQKLADDKFRASGTGIALKADEQLKKPVTVQDNITEVFSLFRVETDTSLIKNHKVSIDPELPEGLVYRIQMGVFSKVPDPSFFKGITPVIGSTIAGSGAVRYFAGMFRKMEDANRSLLAMKQMGFRDSFISAVLDGKAVSIERAALLEKEWGSRPLVTTSATPRQEEPEVSTLVYRVEISRSSTPEPEEVTDTYKKLAGNRGFEIKMTGDGTIVYLIGKFITFESASEYSDLLNRNGYRDAKVVAYLGSREIPLETARKLFETPR